MQPTLVEKALLLKKNPLFQTLELDLLLILAQKAELISYKKDECIVAKQEESNSLYLIIKGEVECFYETRSIKLKNNEIFGDRSVFSLDPYDFKATAKKDCTLLIIQRNYLFATIEQCPGFALALLEFYTKK